MRTVAVVAYRRTVRAVRHVEMPTTSASTSANAHQRWRSAAMRLRSGSARSTDAPVPSCRCSIIDSLTLTSAVLNDRHHADDAQRSRQHVQAERQVFAGQTSSAVQEHDIIREQYDSSGGTPAQRAL